MTARLLFLLLMFFGIAVSPVMPLAGCAAAAPMTCNHCCPSATHGCCDAANSPARSAPVAVESSLDGKQVVQPSLILLGLTPLPAAEPPAIQRQHAARRPALPLLDLNCIRLI